MRIVNDAGGDYLDGPTVKINLWKHDDPNDTERVLFYGYNSMFNSILRDRFSDYKKKILLNLWMPTEYNCQAPIPFAGTAWSPDGKYTDYFDKIYTICPYTIDWLLEEYESKQHPEKSRYRYIWHPFASPDDYGGEPLDYTKKFDVCYFGGIHGKYHRDMAEVLKGYNSRISYIHPNEYTTDWGLTHHQKMQMVANTKISVVFNQCPLHPKHIESIKSYTNWHKNRAFSGVDLPVPTMPQYKCRTAEAAYGKSVILVQRDQWNIIEDFFPSNEFVYFDDTDDLKTKIDMILGNYESYAPMISKAYQRSLKMDGKGTLEEIKFKETP